jgi:multidrug efflux pump subunit AcrA (membrane-fusion protein)
VGLVIGDLVELSLGIGDPIPRLVVPREAIVETSSQTVVFVQDSGESFSRRRVELGEADAIHVEVLSGVAEGERVVSLGAFDVHVASLTGSLESHKH